MLDSQMQAQRALRAIVLPASCEGTLIALLYLVRTTPQVLLSPISLVIVQVLFYCYKAFIA